MTKDKKQFFDLEMQPIPEDKNFKGFEVKNFRPLTKEEKIQHLKELEGLYLRFCGIDEKK